MLDTVRSIRDILESNNVAHTYCGELFKSDDKTWTTEFVNDTKEMKFHNFRFTYRGTLISISCRTDNKWEVVKITSKTGKTTKVVDSKGILLIVSRDDLFTINQLKKANQLMTFDTKCIPSNQI